MCGANLSTLTGVSAYNSLMYTIQKKISTNVDVRTTWPPHSFFFSAYPLQHVTVEDSYLCGYLKIKGLTEVKFETRSRGGPSFHLLSQSGCTQVHPRAKVWQSLGEARFSLSVSTVYSWHYATWRSAEGQEWTLNCGEVGWKTSSLRFGLGFTLKLKSQVYTDESIV